MTENSIQDLPRKSLPAMLLFLLTTSQKVANVLWNCEKEQIRGMKAEGLCQHISSVKKSTSR